MTLVKNENYFRVFHDEQLIGWVEKLDERRWIATNLAQTLTHTASRRKDAAQWVLMIANNPQAEKHLVFFETMEVVPEFVDYAFLRSGFESLECPFFDVLQSFAIYQGAEVYFDPRHLYDQSPSTFGCFHPKDNRKYKQDSIFLQKSGPYTMACVLIHELAHMWMVNKGCFLPDLPAEQIAEGVSCAIMRDYGFEDTIRYNTAYMYAHHSPFQKSIFRGQLDSYFVDCYSGLSRDLEGFLKGADDGSS